MKKELIGIILSILLIESVISVTGLSIKNVVIKDNIEIDPLLNGNTWMKTFGGPDYESVTDGQQTTDGGYIVVGIIVPHILMILIFGY